MARGLYVERSTMLYKGLRRASLAFKYLLLPFRVEPEEAPQKAEPPKRLPTFIPPPPSAQQPHTEENRYQSDTSEVDMSDCEEDSDDEESDESP